MTNKNGEKPCYSGCNSILNHLFRRRSFRGSVYIGNASKAKETVPLFKLISFFSLPSFLMIFPYFLLTYTYTDTHTIAAAATASP